MAIQPSVFIAHSSLDYNYVRIVRNLFEELGHKTLLLELAQQMTQNYLENLLKEEIKARDWIVLVVSENSTASKWVSFEESYAYRYGKPLFYLDLEKCSRYTGQQLAVCLEQQVAKISRDIQIFISYARRDSAFATKITRDLEERGYLVWIDTVNIGPGANWAQQIENAIRETLQRGYMIVLLSENSIMSKWVEHEIQQGLQYPGRVIPCLIKPRIINIPYDHPLREIQWIDFMDRPYKEAFRQLIRVLQ